MRYLFIFILLSNTLIGQMEDWRIIDGRDFTNQSWQSLLDNHNVTFNEVRKSFYREWDGRAFEKHKGVKQFKRMEEEMRGNFHLPYQKRFDFIKKRDKRFTQLKQNNSADWSVIGPISPPNGNNEGIGRINDIEFHPTQSNTIYVSAPNGGIWKTTNGCDSWVNITGSLENETIYDFALNPSNVNIIYAATGSGLYKTQNGGSSWTQIESTLFRKIIIAPSAVNTLYGISYTTAHRTSDGGTTWTQIASTSFAKPYYDLKLQPGSSSTLYISLGGGILKSSDSGANFNTLTLPFISADARDIYIAVTPQNTNALFFVAKSSSSSLLGVYKSLDGGSSFTQIANSSSTTTYLDGTNPISLNNFYWFYNDWPIAVNPNDINEVTFGNVGLFRTLDGGSSWKTVSSSAGGGGSIHVDMMDIKYHPDSHKAYVGCDGGLYKHETDGLIWKRLNNDLPVTQIYRTSISNRVNGKYLIGNQDNGVMKYESSAWIHEVIGDGMDSYIYESDPNVIITATQYGNFRISTDNGGTWSTLLNRTLTAENASWTVPLNVHPLNENDIMIGYENVWHSVDRGITWKKLEVGGVSGQTISRIARSSFNPDHIAIIKRNDLIVSIDGGTTWSTVNTPVVSGKMDIKYSNQSNRLFLLYPNAIYQSNDHGNTWTNFSTGLPSGGDKFRTLAVFNNAVEEYYIGGFGSVYHKEGTNDWSLFENNLPGTIITDLDIDYGENIILASTYGRGLWKSPLANASTIACFDYSVPTLSESGTVNLCDTDAITLSANSAGSGQYIWYKDGKILNGENNQNLIISESGIYNARFSINNCDAYSSEVVTVRFGCSYTQCQDFNSNSSAGSGNTTDISLTAPTASPAQSTTTVAVCITAQGDINFSGQENFNIYDEDGQLLGVTNNGADCGDPSAPICLDIPISIYQAWIADGMIQFSLDPISTQINPNLCSTNQACVEVFFQTDTPGSNCVNDHNLSGSLSGTFDQSYDITIQDATLTTGTAIFKAENCIEVSGPTEISSSVSAEFIIESCSNN